MHWLSLVLVAISLADLALGQYAWAGFLAAMAVIVALRRQYLTTPNGDGPVSIRVFVTFLVGCTAMCVLLTVIVIEDFNAFALIGAVLFAGLAVATVVAILKLRRVEKHR